MKTVKLTAIVSEHLHTEMTVIAAKNRSTLSAIITLAVQQLVRQVKNGTARLPRDRRIEANRRRHKEN